MYTPKPWERQKDETPKPFEAFCVYRDMGTERSLSKVATKLQKSDTIIGRWSSKYSWVKRVTEWDAEQDRINREAAEKERIKAIKKMHDRHIKLAEDMLEKAAAALLSIPDEEIKARDIVSLVDSGTKLERLSRGDAGDVVETREGEAAIPAVQFYIPSNGRDQSDDEEE